MSSTQHFTFIFEFWYCFLNYLVLQRVKLHCWFADIQQLLNNVYIVHEGRDNEWQVCGFITMVKMIHHSPLRGPLVSSDFYVSWQNWGNVSRTKRQDELNETQTWVKNRGPPSTCWIIGHNNLYCPLQSREKFCMVLPVSSVSLVIDSLPMVSRICFTKKLLFYQ